MRPDKTDTSNVHDFFLLAFLKSTQFSFVDIKLDTVKGIMCVTCLSIINLFIMF